MRQAYDSDITREQFEQISGDLESAKKRTSPRRVDLYDIFCAILYLLKNACTWRNIPHDFPKWGIVRYYYDVWTRKNEKGESILDYVHAKLVDLERYEKRDNPTPTMLIVDSKTVQNADTAEEKGYDGGKKKTGVKIHIAVDILGMPYAVLATTANITDRNGAILMFSQLEFSLPSLQTVLCDGGYTGDDFANQIYELTGGKVQVAKRSELHTFAVIPKRWIVERSFGWLDKCRRLWKNCECKLENTLNMVKLAFISILLKRV
jgi:transposase